MSQRQSLRCRVATGVLLLLMSAAADADEACTTALWNVIDAPAQQWTIASRDVRLSEVELRQLINRARAENNNVAYARLVALGDRLHHDLRSVVDAPPIQNDKRGQVGPPEEKQ